MIWFHENYNERHLSTGPSEEGLRSGRPGRYNQLEEEDLL